MLSRSPNVHMSVCLCVCMCVNLFTFEVPFKRIFAPLSEVGCPIFLEIQNPLGKIMERSGLRFEHFSLEIFLNTPQKILAEFALQKLGGNHASQWIRDLWSKGVSLMLAYF